MTYEGAKATILLEYCGADSCEDCDNCVLGKAIEALEKQIPKTPIEYEDKFYACPVCDNIVLDKWEKYPTKLMDKSNSLPYCLGCGQRLNWSDEDE